MLNQGYIGLARWALVPVFLAVVSRARDQALLVTDIGTEDSTFKVVESCLVSCPSSSVEGR